MDLFTGRGRINSFTDYGFIHRTWIFLTVWIRGTCHRNFCFRQVPRYFLFQKDKCSAKLKINKIIKYIGVITNSLSDETMLKRLTERSLTSFILVLLN